MNNDEFGQVPNYPVVNNIPTGRQPSGFNALQPYTPPRDDIEIIDLDDPRRDIKPTTWHVN